MLLFQGELLLIFGSVVMTLVCWDEIQKLEVDGDDK
jgi:hypothetical protein